MLVFGISCFHGLSKTIVFSEDPFQKNNAFSVQVFKSIFLSKYKAKKVKERYTEHDRTCDKCVKLNC